MEAKAERPQFKALKPKKEEFYGLERFPRPAGVREVVMETSEVTALCPVTGQPDWDTVSIRYIPRQWCLESKSLKLYLQQYRNEGIFAEELANRIAEHVY